MSFYRYWACALTITLSAAMVFPTSRSVAAEPSLGHLGLDEAVRLAIEAVDPTLARFDESAAALDHRAVADSRLPDPQVRVGVMNLPVDTFLYGQEAMTKLEVGVQQAFPKGSSLAEKRKRRAAEARKERTAKSVRALEIERDVRRAWLDLYFWSNARGVVQESHAAVSDLVSVVRSFYATGRQTSQDVLRAELELSLLDDRLLEVERQIEMYRADLARFIGPAAAARETSAVLPQAADLPALASMIDAVPRHPAIRVQDARISVRDAEIALARQQYKPGWSVEAAYGARGGNRPDLATVMLRFDLPIFTKNRQDRRLSAARRDRQAARLDREGGILEMSRKLRRAYADWQRLGQRVRLFEEDVLTRASGNSRAALDGYRNKTSDFSELIRSRLSELNLELSLIRLRADRAGAEAELIYLQGDI